jgi:hypothetical protein
MSPVCFGWMRRLAYDVPNKSRRLEFVVQHGAFPNDVIIGNQQSFFHRRITVTLPVAQGMMH